MNSKYWLDRRIEQIVSEDALSILFHKLIKVVCKTVLILQSSRKNTISQYKTTLILNRWYAT